MRKVWGVKTEKEREKKEKEERTNIDQYKEENGETAR